MLDAWWSARSAAVALVVALGALVAPPAAAQDKTSSAKAACVQSFDRGQRARSENALRRAVRELIVCAHEKCPAVLREDCAGVLAQVQAEMPRVVFAAEDAEGHPVVDVKLFLDGELLQTRLDGVAIDVDPGTHTLRFEREGEPPVEVTRSIRANDKNQAVRVALAKRRSAGLEPVAPVPPERKERGRRSAGAWVASGTLAGAGLLALGFAGIARLGFDGRVDELRASCAPDCTASERDDLSARLVTSNVALGVGLGALAAAALAFVLSEP